MHSELCEHEDAHLVGDTATHLMAQPWGALAALLVVARVQPAASLHQAIAPMAAPSGAFNCVFQVEKSLRQRCAQEGRSNSDVMRDPLTAYLGQPPVTRSAWALGQGVFGRYSGPEDLAETRKSQLPDASMVEAAERLPIRCIVSIDKDFDVYRDAKGQVLHNLLR